MNCCKRVQKGSEARDLISSVTGLLRQDKYNEIKTLYFKHPNFFDMTFTFNKFTIMHLAVYENRTELIKLILDNVEEPERTRILNSKDIYHHTPYYLAVLQNNIRIMDLLCSYGYKPEADIDNIFKFAEKYECQEAKQHLSEMHSIDTSILDNTSLTLKKVTQYQNENVEEEIDGEKETERQGPLTEEDYKGTAYAHFKQDNSIDSPIQIEGYQDLGISSMNKEKNIDIQEETTRSWLPTLGHGDSSPKPNIPSFITMTDLHLKNFVLRNEQIAGEVKRPRAIFLEVSISDNEEQ